jgi:hypothetical protein
MAHAESYAAIRERIVVALEAAGVEFLNGIQPGVRLRRTASVIAEADVT